jgi:hypothetical protein
MGLRLALEIGLLPVTVIKPPLFALLMAMLGFPQLPPPGFTTTRVTAVAMPSVTRSADEKERLALFADNLKK